MTTILRIKGASFNDPSFPVLTPFIREGLLGAFRPAVSDASLVDLSGNGALLTKVGSPTVTAQGLLGNKSNGYKTNIAETASHTIMAVGRLKLNGVAGASQISGFFAGNYLVDGGDPRGMGLFYSTLPGTVSGVGVQVQAQTHIKKPSAPLSANMYANGPRLLDNKTPGAMETSVSAWVFMAIVVDAALGKMQFYVPAASASAPFQTLNAADAGGTISGRFLTDPVGGGPNFMQIVSVPTTGFVGESQSEVAEALFYNRALTADEIFRQYQLSQAFMSARRGISI